MNSIIVAMLFVCAITHMVTEVIRNALLRVRNKEYEDGLKLYIESKEELLQRFKSLNTFLIKQVYYNQDGDIEVLGKASKHAFVIENGVVKSKNVLTHTIGKKYKSAIEEVALFDLLAKQEAPSLALDPYSKYKKGMNIGLVHTISGSIILGALAVFLVSMLLPSSDKYIEMVKQGSNENYPNITYEEGFEGFFANPEWNHFTSEKGEVVEFTGDFYYMDEEAEAHFQFLLDLDNSTFTLEYFAINDEPQTVLVTGILLDKVFSDTEDVGEGSVSNNDIDSSNGIEIPEGLAYDEIQLENVAGYYKGLDGMSSLECNMYSSPEGDIVGNVEISVNNENYVYSGELMQIRDNVYIVSSTGSEEIFIGFYQIEDLVSAVVYVDGVLMDFIRLTEYVS